MARGAIHESDAYDNKSEDVIARKNIVIQMEYGPPPTNTNICKYRLGRYLAYVFETCSTTSGTVLAEGEILLVVSVAYFPKKTQW